MAPRALRYGPFAFFVALPLLAACGGSGGGPEKGGAAGDGDIHVTGLSTPESVLHDTVADVYLVSNVSGDPAARDGDGFISRVDPDGQILELRWIDGTAGGFNLNAPKGMAIVGNTLYVADIDCLRLFDRETGEHRKDVCLKNATSLVDVASSPDGSVFFTDSGLKPGAGGLTPSGTDAVYRLIDDDRVVAVKKETSLGNPNGLAVGSRGILVAGYGSGEVYRLDAQGNRTDMMPKSNLELDGIVMMPDGGFMMSAWGDSTVFRVGSDGKVSKVLQGVAAPADIGYDAKRNRVLVPLLNAGEVRIHALG